MKTMQNAILKPLTLTIIALATLVFSSCVPNTTSGIRTRDSSNITTPKNVGMYQGKILADNPVILSKNSGLAETYDLNKLVSVAEITTNSFLTGNNSCSGQSYCFEVRKNKDAPSALQTSNGKWGFEATTPEFLQVNTYYHLNKVMDTFFSNLVSGYGLAYNGMTAKYKTALPLTFRNGLDKFSVLQSPLIAYADCDVADNAYFDRALGTLCFGFLVEHPSVKFAQDATIVYHEAGHFFQKLQLNIRNSLVGPKSDMGNLQYDEAGSIGEGLSDFFSYFVNGRTHFAEWAGGRFLSASRPLTEDDPLHIATLSSDPDQRLSYPEYLSYNPNFPKIPNEDIHTAGMIISHYLVALTTDLQDKCSMTKTEAVNHIMYLLTETLAEHGDLYGKGIEGSDAGRINLSSELLTDSKSLLSRQWFNLVNPINYRTFMQTFGKNLLKTIGNISLNRCNGTYSQDQIESLIDQYGLLLFRTYNENKNLTYKASNGDIDPAKTPTKVRSINRKKSVLISKDLLIFDPASNASSAFVIDNRELIRKGITELQSAGIISKTLSAQTPTDLGFNNNNGRVSPGEVVGIALNLYNNSNSTMGGVQILANDWNHADAIGRPCNFSINESKDKWPLTSEGGVACTLPHANATLTSDNFAPVCFMQLNGKNSTTWVSQKEFSTQIALDSSFCLDPSNTKDCFIRAIRGADQAGYSKLNPNSSWGKTMANPETGKAPSLGWGNVIFFEVSKHIPPGTVIDCRLRARFTNCDDCYHKQTTDNTKTNFSSAAGSDGYEFSDVEMNGPKPFKILHLQIPIVD